MARYIDADLEVSKYVTVWDCDCSEFGKQTVMAVDDLHYLPTADVAPRAEVAREIFEEIEKIIKSPRTVGFCMTAPSFRQAISDYNEGIRKEILYYIAELKKKYTEPEPPKGD